LSSFCSLGVLAIPDANSAQLKAWQLTLDSNLTEYTFPSDIDATFFGVVWSGEISVDSRTTVCTAVGEDADATQLFWIRPGKSVKLVAGGSAEIAVIGIVSGADPSFDPPLVDRSGSNALENPPIDDNHMKTTVLSLEVNVSGGPITADDWVRPAFVLTTPEGPIPKAYDANGDEIALEANGSNPVFVGVPKDLALTFGSGTDSSRAVVCDIALTSDIPRIVGCSWRCHGR